MNTLLYKEFDSRQQYSIFEPATISFSQKQQCVCIFCTVQIKYRLRWSHIVCFIYSIPICLDSREKNLSFAEHSNILLQRHRCGRCAEQISAIAIMRQENCIHCDAPLLWQDEQEHSNILEALQSKWAMRKWIILGAIAVLSFFSGQIPFLQSILLACALIATHILVIRKPLQWLPTGRRIFAKMDIKLLGVCLAIVNLIINVLVIPFLFVNGIILSLLGVLNTFLFVHFASTIIQTRLQWELEKRPFGVHDWIRSVLFLGTLCCIIISGFLMVWGMTEIILHTHIPFIDITFGQLLFGE